MDLKKEVTHTGNVSVIGEKGIKVKIGIIAGCSDCQIKGSCNLVEQSQKELFIECNPSHFKKGQRVKVSLKTSTGKNTVFIYYILPVFVMLIAMLFAPVFIKNENGIGIFSLFSLLPYYFVIFLFRKSFKKKITYIVTPIL
jgi:sigma-E factor negative regulatory protein RseC